MSNQNQNQNQNQQQQAQESEDSKRYSELLPELVKSARECSSLLTKWPSGKDYEFHKSFRGFTSFTRAQLKSHQELMSLISTCYRDSASNPFEAVDELFSNVDLLLDEMKGVRVDANKQEEIRIGVTGLHHQDNFSTTTTASAVTSSAGGGGGGGNQFALQRPQDFFENPLDNFANEFRPYVAVVEDHLENPENQRHRKYISSSSQKHPLGNSIENFEWDPQQLVPPSQEQVFRPLDTTPLTFIDTAETLARAVSSILARKPAEIAVDVEHHDQHSYLGFTCLVQLSTREEDFVIDTIALREEMWRLAPVFHDPTIVKILHWAPEDVRWLQRDFGLFIVNLFDTAVAMQTLRMPASLAFLVDHLCQIKLDKTHQTSDWRIRPLGEDMIRYARQDTHYLLYCYDRLRGMLAAADTRASVGNLLVYVLQESKRTAQILYKKPVFSESATWKEMLGRSIAGLQSHQLKAIQALFNWREVRARTVDTSPVSILSNGQLLSIGCRLPSTAAEVLRMTNPPSVEVRRNVKEILQVLNEARSLKRGFLDLNKNNNSPNKKNSLQQQQKQQQQQQKNTSSDGQQQQREFVHCPMTGTLPSVMMDDENNSSSRTEKQELEQEESAFLSMNNNKSNNQNNNNNNNSNNLPVWMSIFQRLPNIDVSSHIDVPLIPRQKMQQQQQQLPRNNMEAQRRDREEQEKKKKEEKEGEDEDEDEEEEEGEEEKNNIQAPPQPSGKDDKKKSSDEMPKSLLDEFQSARSNRKKARREQNKKQ